MSTIDSKSVKPPTAKPVTDKAANFRSSAPIEKSNISQSSSKNRFGIQPLAQSTEKQPKQYCIAHVCIYRQYSTSKKPLSIQPGNGTIKAYDMSNTRTQKFKKVGIRIAYSIKQLLSIRDKTDMLSIINNADIISGVFEEGIGTAIGRPRTSTTAITIETVSKMATNDVWMREQRVIVKGDDDKKAGTLRNITKEQPSISISQTNDDIIIDEQKDVEIDGENNQKLSERKKNKKSYQIPKYEQKSEDQPRKEKKYKLQTKVKKDQEIVQSLNGKSSGISSGGQNIESEVVYVLKSEENEEKKSSLSSRTGGWKGRNRGNIDPFENFVGRVNVRLNKITLDNFETVSSQLISIFETDVNNAQYLLKFVSMIFSKTVQEHAYCPLYARLCVQLSDMNKLLKEEYSKSGSVEVRMVGFKSILLRQCELEFRKGKCEPDITADMDAEDIKNAYFKERLILMGRMKFIGQLYLHQMLPSKIMILCLKQMIGPSHLDEDDVEAACCLLETVGRALDEDINERSRISNYYNKLASIERNRKYAPRIRILVSNLLELRKDKWTNVHSSRREYKLQTKEEIHAEWQKTHRNARTSSSTSALNAFSTEEAADRMMQMFESRHGLPAMFVQSSNMVDYGQGEIVFRGNVLSKTNTNAKLPRRRRYGDSNHTQMDAYGNYISSESAANSNLMTVYEQPVQKPQIRQKTRRPRNYHRSNFLLKSRMNIQQTQQQSDFQQNTNEYKSNVELLPNMSTNVNVRPLTNGDLLSNEKFDEISSAYLSSKIKAEQFLKELENKSFGNRIQFIDSLLRKALDRSAGGQERFSQLISKLMMGNFINIGEFDECLSAFFREYVSEMSDNPQLHRGMATIIASLIVDKVIGFGLVLGWMKLDVRFVNNLSRKYKRLKMRLVFLGLLLLEIKEVSFFDSGFTRKLMKEHKLTLELLTDNDEQVADEWMKTFKLKFAFSE